MRRSPVASDRQTGPQRPERRQCRSLRSSGPVSAVPPAPCPATETSRDLTDNLHRLAKLFGLLLQTLEARPVFVRDHFAHTAGAAADFERRQADRRLRLESAFSSHGPVGFGGIGFGLRSADIREDAGGRVSFTSSRRFLSGDPPPSMRTVYRRSPRLPMPARRPVTSRTR